MHSDCVEPEHDDPSARPQPPAQLWSPRTSLFEQADILTIHVVLSSRHGRGLVGAAELARNEAKRHD